MVARTRLAVRVAALCLTLAFGVACKKKSPATYAGSHSTPTTSAAAPASLPEIKRPVTDLAGKLTAADTESIARALVDHQAATGVQLAVLVVDTTGGQPIEDYAQQVFEQWGGGSAERNDGALFVLAIADRRNRLHLGYGLEPVIPDASAKRMLDDLRPHLRAANYAAATRQLVSTFRDRTAHLTPGGPRKPPLGAYPWLWIVMVMLGLVGGIAWGVAFKKGLTAWHRLPMRWSYRAVPPWAVRARITIVDFFRYRPALITAAALVGVQLLLLFVFRTGDGYRPVYSLVFWMFIPVGWVMTVSAKLVRIPTAILAIGFVVLAFKYGEPAMLADAEMLHDAVFPWLQGFLAGAFIMFFCVVAPISGAASGSGGGGSYSSSSSRSSYSSSSSRSYSSSSSSSSYSGGGGRSGGGGASSSW